MSQRLVLPLNDLRVTAGYKSKEYLAYWKFQHFGIDCTSSVTTVYACGDGEVIACGMDGKALTGETARLGNVIAIVYRDVLRNDGVPCDLVCRMFHFAEIRCKVGDKVTKDTVIGLYGNTGRHSTGPHLHIEFDTDIKYPFHAYGIAGDGGIILAGTIDSSVNPAHIWFCDGNQTIKAAANAWTTASDVCAPALPRDKPAQETVAFTRAEWDALFDTLAAREGII